MGRGLEFGTLPDQTGEFQLWWSASVESYGRIQNRPIECKACDGMGFG